MVFFASCALTENNSAAGIALIKKFAKETNANYVFSSDHNLVSGYSYDGANDLNASAYGHWGITTVFPFIRREGAFGSEANDYHMARPNEPIEEVFDLRILQNGRIVFNNKDNLTTGSKSADLKF